MTGVGGHMLDGWDTPNAHGTLATREACLDTPETLFEVRYPM